MMCSQWPSDHHQHNLWPPRNKLPRPTHLRVKMERMLPRLNANLRPSRKLRLRVPKNRNTTDTTITSTKVIIKIENNHHDRTAITDCFQNVLGITSGFLCDEQKGSGAPDSVYTKDPLTIELGNHGIKFFGFPFCRLRSEAWKATGCQMTESGP